jgi:hypothetical protein
LPGCARRCCRVAIDPSRVDEHCESALSDHDGIEFVPVVVLTTGGDKDAAVLRLVLCRDPASIDRKSDAVDEAGIITGEEDDRRSKFLGLSYAACWC